ncbi:Branchpoint-bridging protein [Rhynchospora pubera]|uniref:Branchpoint-bridging protein n=1 Tax=Rhynchospora pubera TaxID=906938 RepID=A0AAV8EVJ9_9POAL|nr:Branchpoint-bridging protein [Rhynchospora pubera]
MASKVDQSSATSSKVSMLRPKFGFVIPKNKLSGSLIRTSKGSTKNGSNSAIEDSTKQSQRKTKFSSYFIPDTSVRKRKALVYQTRLDQISKRLKKSEQHTGEVFVYEPSVSPTQASNTESNKKQLDKMYRELLDLERREIIGELLKLNPSFKAPADYKPLLKEAKIPVPTREYAGYNFIRMLLGAESNTQKKLQDETGAKIRVHGAKKGTGDKHEITQTDINEAQTTYEDIYINVSAETYDKVDAAVALLEQLLASASSVLVSSKPASPATQPVVTSFPSNTQFPSNPSPCLPPRAPPGPLNSVSVPSSAVQPLQTSSSFQYRSYTGQLPPVRPNSVLMPLSPAGPGPHRPLESPPPRQPPVPFPQISPNSTPGAPYHAQMRGPPARPGDMHAAPPQLMGPLPPRPHVSPYTPIQAPRMATPSNHPMMRPPGPTSGDFAYQPRQPFPAYQNPGNQFGYRIDPREYGQPQPRHHGFQYPNQQRERMDPYGYPSAPRPGPMMQNWDRPTGRNSNPNRGYGAPPGPRGGQYYDPFMPSSTCPVRPRKERRGEADPEYEDLMASVGVK